ncbi:hypothetical protein WR25_03397 [Diploscapter pachys]|uniref:Protein kinase domain-containing protein n=1 Tax=Diploscapter pachys TaxID=2018661 RepID=A0A2A2LU14_9BILA|nr:hypothetical protein WR25_03397 [Diploscapter pachys]
MLSHRYYSCSASYMNPWATIITMTGLYILGLFWFCKRGKTACLPVPDSIFPYQKRLKQLERDLSYLTVDDVNIEITETALGQGFVLPKTENRFKQKVCCAVKMSFPIPSKSIILLEEAARMARLDHPNIVKIIAVSKLSFSVLRPLIVMEWLPGGSLSEYFRHYIREREERERSTIKLREILHILSQIAEALKYIHNSEDDYGREFTHGDIAARNVLLTSIDISECTAKLGDFGVPVDCGKFPIAWMPPEVLCAAEPYFNPRQESDTWMFGVLIWECLTLGAEPHFQRSIDEIRRCFKLPDKGLACPPGTPLDV